MLLARQTLAWATGSASSPCFVALLRDLERASLAAGPSLRRVYSAARVAAMREQLAPIGFVELDGPEVFGYRPILLDLGPESADAHSLARASPHATSTCPRTRT